MKASACEKVSREVRRLHSLTVGLTSPQGKLRLRETNNNNNNNNNNQSIQHQISLVNIQHEGECDGRTKRQTKQEGKLIKQDSDQ